MSPALRHVLRALRRTPWYSSTVIGVMAIVLTLSAVVFAIVDGVLFRPLPYPDADRLFAVRPGVSGVVSPDYGTPVGVADLSDWTAAASGAEFTGFSAAPTSDFGPGVNDYIAGVARVQRNVFDVLGVRPLLGGFTDADFERADRVLPVCVTWDVWQDRFHGAPDILGRTVIFDRARQLGFRVVGVMPRGFSFPSERAEVQFLTPLVTDRLADADPRRRGFRDVIVRVATGVTLGTLGAQVEAGMAATARRFPPREPREPGWTDAEWRLQGPYDRADVRPLASTLGERSRALFLAVFAGVMALVGLGALNTSGLMAARALEPGWFQRAPCAARRRGPCALRHTLRTLRRRPWKIGDGTSNGRSVMVRDGRHHPSPIALPSPITNHPSHMPPGRHLGERTQLQMSARSSPGANPQG